MERPSENRHVQPTPCRWSTGVREAHRGWKTKETLRQKRKHVGETNLSTDTREGARLESTFYLLLLFTVRLFGLNRHLILPADWRRSQGGIRKSLLGSFHVGNHSCSDALPYVRQHARDVTKVSDL